MNMILNCKSYLGICPCCTLERLYQMSHQRRSDYHHIEGGDYHKDAFLIEFHHHMKLNKFPSCSILPKLHGLKDKEIIG